MRDGGGAACSVWPGMSLVGGTESEPRWKRMFVSLEYYPTRAVDPLPSKGNLSERALACHKTIRHSLHNDEALPRTQAGL